jgi:hypothetical protein
VFALNQYGGRLHYFTAANNAITNIFRTITATF